MGYSKQLDQAPSQAVVNEQVIALMAIPGKKQENSLHAEYACVDRVIPQLLGDPTGQGSTHK